MKGKSITIIGKGENTVLELDGRASVLVVHGTDHNISHVKITQIQDDPRSTCLRVEGGKNCFRDVFLSGAKECIKISGSDNKFDKVNISEARVGINISGSQNELRSIMLDGVTSYCVRVSGSSNTISDITAKNAKYCIISSGGYNKFCEIKFDLGKYRGNRESLVKFEEFAHFNQIENYTAYNTQNSRPELFITSNNCIVSSSIFNSVYIHGNNATLTDVDGGEEIYIYSDSNGVVLKNCNASFLTATHKVQRIASKFEEVQVLALT